MENHSVIHIQTTIMHSYIHNLFVFAWFYVVFPYLTSLSHQYSNKLLYRLIMPKRQHEELNTLPNKRIASPVCERYRKFVNIKLSSIEKNRSYAEKVSKLELQMEETEAIKSKKVREQTYRKLDKELTKVSDEQYAFNNKTGAELEKIKNSVPKKDNLLTTTAVRFDRIFELIPKERAIELLFANRIFYEGDQITADELFKDVDKFYYDTLWYENERIVWIDPYDYVCELPVRHYGRGTMELERNSPEDFWSDFDEDSWEHLANLYYKNFYAYKVIHRAIKPWLTKPITADGRCGIYASTGYKGCMQTLDGASLVGK